MAVQPQTPYKEYDANGVAKSFNLEFDCENKDHLIVTIDGIEPPSETWSLDPVAKSVTFTTAPDAGKKITLKRNTPYSRTTSYQSYDNSFRPGPVNKDLDRLWWKVQELGVSDWLLDLKLRKFRDDVNLTALEDTLEQAEDLRNQTASLKAETVTLKEETESNVEQSRTLLNNTTDQAVAAEASASSANTAKTQAQQASLDAVNQVNSTKTYVDSALSDLSTAANKFYPTKAEAEADIANIAVNQPVTVGESGTNGGLWYKATAGATILTKSAFDPLTQSKEFTLDQVMPISEKIGPLVVRSLSPESGFVLAWEDPVTGRCPIRIGVDGTFYFDKGSIPKESVSRLNLDSELSSYTPISMPIESGYVWGLGDANSGRFAMLIEVDGTVHFGDIVLPKDVIKSKSLNIELSRQVLPHREDVQQTYIDPWRATKTEISLKTQGAGYWNQLPAFKTKAIFGTNTTGTSISIRKTANLPILGKYYAGEWSASNVASLRNVGSLTGPSVSNPSGTFTAGDYYYYANGSAVESTGTHAGMNVGDLLVYNGSTWVIQKAPGTVSSRGQNGYFWKVTADCTFDSVTYKAGDFILYVTRQTGGGGWQYERWMKINKVKGDLVYMGIVSALPASPLNNTVYEVGVAFDSYSVGDYLMYSNDAWMHIKNVVETVIANNASFYLTCTDASEYEVRRTDKSASSLGFSASCYIQSNVAKSTDELLLISDSMFGSGGVGAAILSESARTGTVKSFGGSTSNQVMGMLEYFISQGDEFKGQTVIAWHGQNNQPSNAVNAALIRECSLKMQQLVGAIHSRIAFLSILGQRNLSWNVSSNRYVASQHENQKAKTGHLWELQDWYNKTFPNRHISPYQILIDAADDTPDPTFPGMTEKQVAQTYGIVPYSFFGGTMGEWGDVTNLRYLGNWSSSSLPTETANQFDYYLRTGGGSASEFLLVYINGQWVQKSMDITHLSNKGATALAKGVAKFLTENKM